THLSDVVTTTDELHTAYTRATTAIDDYHTAIVKAQKSVDLGDAEGEKLRSLLEDLSWGHSEAFRKAEPLDQWEDLRSITNPIDWVNEFPQQDRINKIRDQAERLYHNTAFFYDDPKNTEKNARDACLAALRSAYHALPTLTMKKSDTEKIISESAALRDAMNQHLHDPDVRLPGRGPLPPIDTHHTNLSD